MRDESAEAASAMPEDDGSARRRWMSILATARPDDLEAAWETLADKPGWTMLRPLETGMIMARGRVGGIGQPFNLGEMTVTRCVIRLADGRVGYGCVGGRNRRHAELAAVIDAMMLNEADRERTETGLIDRLLALREVRRREQSEKAAATAVEFFTMVRGD